MYDLQQRQFVNLPRLNRRDAIAESPSLSYSGRYIVYMASDSARPEIELYDRALQQPQVLTGGFRGWFRNPSISPDGRYVVFESGMRGQWDIEVLDRGPGVELDLPDFQRSRPSPGGSP
jgi:Tol biopolymer transport system component